MPAPPRPDPARRDDAAQRADPDGATATLQLQRPEQDLARRRPQPASVSPTPLHALQVQLCWLCSARLRLR
jgi:hypothetical protein